MRILLAILLALTAVPAWAKWVAVTESGSTVYYIDPGAIRKEGDLRRLFLLEERKRPGTGGEMSRKSQLEFDCKSGTSRTRGVSGYTGGMGGGEVLYNTRGNDRPHAVETDSVEGRVLARACAQ